MNKKITRFAFGAKCAPANARSAASAENAKAPNPQAELLRKSRREEDVSLNTRSIPDRVDFKLQIANIKLETRGLLQLSTVPSRTCVA
jgi:hypothetical protein